MHICTEDFVNLSAVRRKGGTLECTTLLRKRFQTNHINHNTNAFRKTKHSANAQNFSKCFRSHKWLGLRHVPVCKIPCPELASQHLFTGHMCKNMKDLLNQQVKQALWFQSCSKTIRTPKSYWAAIWLWNGNQSLVKPLNEVCLCQHSLKDFFGAFKPSKGKAECIRSLTWHFNQQWDQNRSKSRHVHVDIIWIYIASHQLFAFTHCSSYLCTQSRICEHRGLSHM